MNVETLPQQLVTAQLKALVGVILVNGMTDLGSVIPLVTRDGWTVGVKVQSVDDVNVNYRLVFVFIHLDGDELIVTADIGLDLDVLQTTYIGCMSFSRIIPELMCEFIEALV
jgi:hypothetical protein